MNDSIYTTRKGAFTLVELLVVIGIIALLIGILMPVISKVRAKGAGVACSAQLADIGRLFQVYLIGSKDTLPYVNELPSMQPPINAYPSIVATLNNVDKIADATDGTKVWRCPADTIMEPPTAGIPTGFDRYFDREGSSYKYDLSGRAGDKWQQIFVSNFSGNARSPSSVVVFFDWDNFHGRAGSPGARNYLFADGHVGDLQ